MAWHRSWPIGRSMYISLTGETGPVKTSQESVDPCVSAKRGASASARFKRQHVKHLSSILSLFVIPCRLFVSYSCTQPNNRRTTRPPLFCDPCLTVFLFFFFLGCQREREREGGGIFPCDFVHHRWGHKCMCRGRGDQASYPSRFARARWISYRYRKRIGLKKPSKRKKDVEVHWTRVNVCDASRWSHAVHLSLRRDGIGRREGKEKWWHCVIVVCMGERYRKRLGKRLPYYSQERKERHFWYIHTHTRSVDLSLCIFTSYQAVVVCCCCISGCDRSLDSWLKAHSDSITDLFLLCLFLFSSSNVLIGFSLLCVVYLFSFFLSLYTDINYMRLIFTKCHLSYIYIFFFCFSFSPLFLFWQIIEKSMRIECKCHGVSGSCSIYAPSNSLSYLSSSTIHTRRTDLFDIIEMNFGICFRLVDNYFQVHVSCVPAGRPCHLSARWVTIPPANVGIINK